MTHVSGDTADDDLLLAGGLNGGTEVTVVPGVDLTTPANDSDVGVHLSNLGEERTVGAWNARENEHLGNCPTGRMIGKEITLIRARGDDDGETVGLAQGCVEDDVVVNILDAVVTDDADEADLVVDDEQSGVVPIDSLERVCSH